MWQLSYPTANDVSEGRYLGQKVNFSLKYSLFVICYKKFLLREREREREMYPSLYFPSPSQGRVPTLSKIVKHA